MMTWTQQRIAQSQGKQRGFHGKGRSKLKNIKVRLDEEYFKGLSERQRRTSTRIMRKNALSTRPCPTDDPRWAVRDLTD